MADLNEVVVILIISMIFIGKALYDLGKAEGSIAVKKSIRKALNELGVPGPDYPAPVANAVEILQGALKGETVTLEGVDPAPRHKCSWNEERHGGSNG